MPDTIKALDAAGAFLHRQENMGLLAPLGEDNHVLLRALLQAAFIEGAAWAVAQIEARVAAKEARLCPPAN